MPFYPWPPVIALLMLIYVVYTNYLDPKVGRPSLLAAAVIILAAAAYYKFVLARRGPWILQAPSSEQQTHEPPLASQAPLQFSSIAE
jgi:hypothetical protein